MAPRVVARTARYPPSISRNDTVWLAPADCMRSARSASVTTVTTGVSQIDRVVSRRLVLSVSLMLATKARACSTRTRSRTRASVGMP